MLRIAGLRNTWEGQDCLTCGLRIELGEPIRLKPNAYGLGIASHVACYDAEAADRRAVARLRDVFGGIKF